MGYITLNQSRIVTLQKRSTPKKKKFINNQFYWTFPLLFWALLVVVPNLFLVGSLGDRGQFFLVTQVYNGAKWPENCFSSLLPFQKEPKCKTFLTMHYIFEWIVPVYYFFGDLKFRWQEKRMKTINEEFWIHSFHPRFRDKIIKHT